MACFVVIQPLCRMGRLWHLLFLYLSQEIQREGILSERSDTRAVLFFSSPAKTTGCCQEQCKWEYTYSEREGEGKKEGEREVAVRI